MSLPNGLELRFHPKETRFPTWYDKREEAPKHPCFIASGVHHCSQQQPYHCEAYQFYFSANLAVGLFGVNSKSKALGYHEHDVEGILVLFDRATKLPKWVYFKAHGSGQGVWKAWEECQKTENGALVVYIAWGSHATYPSDKNSTRIFGLANDSVSRKGKRIHIKEDSYVLATHVQLAPGIVIYASIQNISNDSVTAREKFLLPVVQKDLKKRAFK